MTIDRIQNRNINLLIAAVGALGSIALFMGYIHTKKHSKLQEEVLSIDKEIKKLELEKKRNEVKK